jgi:hypothetical protein
MTMNEIMLWTRYGCGFMYSTQPAEQLSSKSQLPILSNRPSLSSFSPFLSFLPPSLTHPTISLKPYDRLSKTSTNLLRPILHLRNLLRLTILSNTEDSRILVFCLLSAVACEILEGAGAGGGCGSGFDTSFLFDRQRDILLSYKETKEALG